LKIGFIYVLQKHIPTMLQTCVSVIQLGAIVKGYTFCGFFLQHFLHKKL